MLLSNNGSIFLLSTDVRYLLGAFPRTTSLGIPWLDTDFPYGRSLMLVPFLRQLVMQAPRCEPIVQSEQIMSWLSRVRQSMCLQVIRTWLLCQHSPVRSRRTVRCASMSHTSVML